MGNKHGSSSSSLRGGNNSKYSVLEPGDEITIKQQIQYHTQSFDEKVITVKKSYVSKCTNRLVVIPQFFSETECKDMLINKCHNFQNISDEYPREYRNATRELVTDKELADLIFDRIKQKIDLNQIGTLISPYGLDSRGSWVACGVNECMRFSQYKAGEYFKIHTDGQFRRNDNERSIYTLLIYLNQDFSGGDTRFLNDPTKLDNEDQFDVLYTLKPSVGSLALFNQDFYHEGCSVSKGVKYILRTEIMYLRKDAHSFPRDEKFEQSESFQEIGKLFRESEKYEKYGDVYSASESYFQAQKMLLETGKTFEYLLNRNYFKLDRPVENSKENDLTMLPEEIAFIIFSFLKEGELCSLILPLNRYLNSLGRSPILWKSIYQKYWDGSTFLKLCEKDELTDWYRHARTRNFNEHQFRPICIDITSKFVNYGLYNDNVPTETRPYIARYSGVHYNFYSYEDAMLGESGGFIFDFFRDSDDERVSRMNVWTFFGKVSEGVSYSPNHPLLVCIPPEYLKQKNFHRFVDLVLKTQVPAVCFLSRHTMIAYYHKISNCIVIEKDENITISLVVNGTSYDGDVYIVNENISVEKELKKAIHQLTSPKKIETVNIEHVILIGLENEEKFLNSLKVKMPQATIITSKGKDEAFRGSQMFAKQEDFRNLCTFWNGQMREY